jgi:uncharacterized membrane protein YkoI
VGLNAGLAEKVGKDQVPDPVQKTLKASHGERQVKEIQKETRDGKIVYEFEFEAPGLNPKLVIAEDGQVVKDTRLGAHDLDRGKGDVLGKGALTRLSTLKISDLPDAVQKKAREMAAGREIVDIDKETWSGQTVYEVEFAQAGRNAQVHFNEQGTVVKNEDTKASVPRGNFIFGNFLGTQLEDTPARVQETVKKEAQGGIINDIDKETRTGQVVYEVEIKKEPSLKYEIHVTENGTIIRDSRIEAAGAQNPGTRY